MQVSCLCVCVCVCVCCIMMYRQMLHILCSYCVHCNNRLKYISVLKLFYGFLISNSAEAF